MLVVVSLIHVWITAAIQSSSVVELKSNPVISLAVQSIVIVNSQSVTHVHVAHHAVAELPPVRYAGVYTDHDVFTTLSGLMNNGAHVSPVSVFAHT